MKNRFQNLFFLWTIFFSFPVFGQSSQSQKGKLIQLINANEIFGGIKYGEGINLLKGDVRLFSEGYTLESDSTFLNEIKNTVRSYGNVHVNVADTVHLFGDVLHYNGHTKFAKIYGNVRMVDKDMTLTTDTLYYNGEKGISYYNGGGKIEDQKSTLTSKEGVYNLSSKDIDFKKKVLVDHPKHTINSHNLRYNRISKIAYFYGPSTIVQKQGNTKIYTERGSYNTNTEISYLTKNSLITYESQVLSGDSLYYNKKAGIGTATGNFEMIDLKEKGLLRGGYGEYHEFKDSAYVVKKAVAIKVFLKDSIPQDSLFIHGDILTAVRKKPNLNRILRVYYNAKFFKPDFQGKCDSIHYDESDGLMRLIGAPVIWSGVNQITGDTIILKTIPQKKQLDSLKVLHNSFVVSLVDSLALDSLKGDTLDINSLEYNQVKGKYILGKFIKNDLKYITVLGNAESVYYVDDTKKIDSITKKPERIGINKAKCTSIFVEMNLRKMKSVSCRKQARSVLYPESQLPKNSINLRGLIWRENERIRNKNDIFKK